MISAFNFFDKVYCINLDSRPDRWQEAVQEFETLGISSYTRVPGIVTTNGRIGFTKAMCRTIELALHEGHEHVLICEDDFYFPQGSAHAAQKIHAAVSQLPDDWDALYLGGTLTAVFHNPPALPYSKNLLRLNSAFATHTIAYSKKGLQALVEGVRSPTAWSDTIIARYEVFDVYLAKEYLHKNKCYITSELLSLQRPGYSDICNNHQNYLGLMQDAFNQFVVI